MRCEECGHDLNGIGDTAPCPECGVVTPPGRRVPGPLPHPGKLLVGFGWPAMAVMAIALLSILLEPVVNLAQPVAAMLLELLVLGVLALVFAIGPLNTAIRVHRLMMRVPRRVRAAPLLLFIPRDVCASLLAGMATVPIMAAIAFGGCLLVVGVGESRARARSDALIESAKQVPFEPPQRPVAPPATGAGGP